MYRDELDWDDARLFLAVARAGSLRAAGRTLGLSQPTVGRRLARFETAAHAAPLFDRLPDGLRLTAAGAALLPLAERLEAAALALHRHQTLVATAPATVRIAVGEWAGGFLAGCLAQEPGLPQDVVLELAETTDATALTRRGAEFAVRHGRPERGDLTVSRIGTIACAAYRLRQAPASTMAWIAYTEEQARYAVSQWLLQHMRDHGGGITMRASSLAMQLRAVRAGAGAAILPCYLGDADPSLERIHGRIGELDAVHWLSVPPDLRRAPRVRAVIDWVRDRFARHRALLEGRISA